MHCCRFEITIRIFSTTVGCKKYKGVFANTHIHIGCPKTRREGGGGNSCGGGSSAGVGDGDDSKVEVVVVEVATMTTVVVDMGVATAVVMAANISGH